MLYPLTEHWDILAPPLTAWDPVQVIYVSEPQFSHQFKKKKKNIWGK